MLDMRVRAIVVLWASFGGADADLILHHGKMITVDASFSIAEAVAIKAGRITAVGAARKLLAREARTRYA